jgi:hypothetical protein
MDNAQRLGWLWCELLEIYGFKTKQASASIPNFNLNPCRCTMRRTRIKLTTCCWKFKPSRKPPPCWSGN